MFSDKSTRKADAVLVNEDKDATGPVIFHPMEQGDESVPFVRGEVQPLEYRDINFARAFYVQVAAVLTIAIFYGPAAFRGDESSQNGTTGTFEEQENYNEDEGSGSSLFFVLVSAMLATALGIAGFMSLIISHTEAVLRVSFFSAPALLFAFGVVLFIVDPDSEANDPDPDSISAGSGIMIQALVFAFISACVYHAYKRYIPFAVSTLQVASFAVRANRGLYLLTATMPFILAGWFVLWGVALVGVFANADTATVGNEEWDSEGEKDVGGPNGFVVLVLLFAFYWTRYVIMNVFHTTTAGTVGAWWFTPLADPSLCSMDVLDSLRRSLTYSFGSICFGSLVVALIQTLESMAKSARRNRDGANLLACILECILYFIRRWVEYFNSWAFCYVGLYGYDFLTAGKNVVSLFTNKGWSTFASDRLVFRVLYFAYLGVAILSGGAACLADVMAGPLLPGDDLSGSRWVAFVLGFILGAMVSQTALFVIESAVRTVIVCFAESPAEFQECHPDLCQLMKDGWAKAYPEQWSQCPIVWTTATATGSLSPNATVATATPVTQEQTSLFADPKEVSAFAVEKGIST